MLEVRRNKKIELQNLDDNIKIEVAIEMLMENISDATRKISNNEKNKKAIKKISFRILKNKIDGLIKQRDDIYSGNFEVINDIISNYKLKNIELEKLEKNENPLDIYKLKEVDKKLIFEKIFKIMTKGKKPVSKPIAIINLGAPGSGKTGLNGYSLNQQKRKNAVIINGDEIRKFHPKYKEILAQYPNDYAIITGQASNYWTSRLINECIKNKYNIIFEGTGRSLEILNTINNQMKDYKVTVRVLVVGKVECLISILKRYKTLKDKTGVGRLIEIEKFNKSYDNLITNINVIEDNNISVEVYKRGKKPEKPILVYNSKNEKNHEAMKILESERKKSEEIIKSSKKIIKEFTTLIKLLTKEEKKEASKIILEIYKELLVLKHN